MSVIQYDNVMGQLPEGSTNPKILGVGYMDRMEPPQDQWWMGDRPHEWCAHVSYRGPDGKVVERLIPTRE